MAEYRDERETLRRRVEELEREVDELSEDAEDASDLRRALRKATRERDRLAEELAEAQGLREAQRKRRHALTTRVRNASSGQAGLLMFMALLVLVLIVAIKAADGGMVFWGAVAMLGSGGGFVVLGRSRLQARQELEALDTPKKPQARVDVDEAPTEEAELEASTPGARQARR